MQLLTRPEADVFWYCLFILLFHYLYFPVRRVTAYTAVAEVDVFCQLLLLIFLFDNLYHLGGV